MFFHGNGQTGAVWRQTPDGRPGWAYYLIDQGYTVYMVDYPARGRSPYVPGVDGKLGIRTAQDLSQIWTGPVLSGGNFPRMQKYTQWPSDSPKKGTMGDPVFDYFAKGQMQFVNNQAEVAIPAGVALLDKIGSPVILLTHSQGGGIGFNVADERPKLIAGMVSIEPGGPQIGNVDTAKVAYTRVNPGSWGLTPQPMKYDPPFASPADIKVHLEPSERPGDEVGCYMQDEPVHKLVGYQNMPILSHLRRRNLSSRVRRLHPQVAESSRSERRLRAPGRRRHPRQHARNVSRPQQPGRHQVHRRLAQQERQIARRNGDRRRE